MPRAAPRCRSHAVQAQGPAPTAACGLCVVRNKGGPRLLRACCTPLDNGMEIVTHDREIVDVRRSTLELILSTTRPSA